MRTVRTDPRELPARYVKAGDELAMYEAETGAGEEDSGRRLFARSEAFVTGAPSVIDWVLVIEGAELVRPPAAPDEVPARPEAVVQHAEHGWWSLVGSPRPFVPDGVDHVGSHRLVIAPVHAERLGAPIVVYADEGEQFVIRERVVVREGQPATPAGITRDRSTRAVLTLLERAAPGTLPSWRCSRIEEHEGHVWADQSHVGVKGHYRCDGKGHANIRNTEATRAALAVQSIDCGADLEERGSAGADTTQALPMRRVPLGVLGVPMGHGVAADDHSWEYTRDDTKG